MIQFQNAVDKFGKIILNELKESNIICWIAGGSVRDYFSGIPIKTDFDLFFPNETEYEKTKNIFKLKESEIKWESENGCKIKYKNNIFDLVKKYYENPQITINSFDFTVSMFAIDYENVYFGETSFIDLSKKQLIINKITFPASTLSRAFRYYEKNFKMCKSEIKKLFESIQNFKTQEIKVENVNTNSSIEISSGELNDFFKGID